MADSPDSHARSIRALLRSRRYAYYLLSRVALIMTVQMLSVAVGWQIYAITGQALALGFSGLAFFLPGFFLALVGGHVADKYDRRGILVICNFGVVLASAALLVMALLHVERLSAIYGVLALLGGIRAFSGPAGQALLPNLVERQDLERAVALGSSGWQLAMIVGPSVGGALYAVTGMAAAVYGACTLSALVTFGATVAIGPSPKKPRDEGASKGAPSWSVLLAGIRYVRSNKAILGAISLDLFAVLLGGAVALLPIFSKDILHTGPWGLGILRSAPAVGAGVVALTIAHHPLRRRAGVVMFAFVLLFGLATIVFGLSTNFRLSVVALFVLGASDMFSVVVRSTLIQTRTPDEMRGRVGAVNLVFVGASNELGEFESGVTAAWLGPRAAVVLGGIGTCLVVLAWSTLFPELRDVDRLDA